MKNTPSYLVLCDHFRPSRNKLRFSEEPQHYRQYEHESNHPLVEGNRSHLVHLLSDELFGHYLALLADLDVLGVLRLRPEHPHEEDL